MNNIPMVSVAVITYNHSKYIRQALDSILMQKVDFEYEIVVGDDCSPDDTQDILREYQALYPDKFKMILRDKNIGGTKNGYDVKMHCTGKYVAHLEGDDYWIDQNKLQKQVDFLNANPEYIGTAHKMIMVGEGGQKLTQQYYPDCKDRIYTLDHYGRGLLPGHAATLVYRNIYREHKYDYSIFYKAHDIIGDRTLALILAGLGNIYCFDEKMSCYRYVTNQGTSFSAQAKYRNDFEGMYKYYSALSDYCKNELQSDEALKIMERNRFIMAIRVSMGKNRIKPMVIFNTYKETRHKGAVGLYTVGKIISLPLRRLVGFLKK
jgi:glycosyltransferase involved in cell wall biosynthesis